MSYNLEILAQHRDALLLAEVAAWLHDWEKCTDEHVNNQARPGTFSPKKRIQFAALGIGSYVVHLLGETIAFDKLTNRQNGSSWLVECLSRCHRASHIEKEEPADRAEAVLFNQLGKQPATDTRPSSPFGYEGSPWTGLTASLMGLPFGDLTNCRILGAALQRVFSQALGDTRRPINEVTLWDWSTLAASLYKVALAGALLGYQPQPADLRWRLLSIRVDESAFLDHITRFPDLLARQRLLEAGFERVRILLEETYPFGTEVYRDESGSMYVVPNLSNLCNLTDATGTTLEALIRRECAQGTVANDPTLALSGEVVPGIEFDTRAWWGQRPDFKSQPSSLDEVPPVGRLLRKAVSTHADAQTVAVWWTGVARDICPVCGLRPQAPPNSKAGRRKVCEVCEQRRDDRAKTWVSNLDTTIWTDEVADDNGRLALVVGQFDLTHWLDGMMVRTLTVVDPARAQDKTADKIAKNPSFARIRRVWETTRAFWQTALDERGPDGGALLPQPAPRLEIIPQNRHVLDLGLFHTYELVVNSIHISVVWDSVGERFITCDNLTYLAKPEQLGRSVEQVLYEAKDRCRPITVEEPVGYGGKNKVWGTIVVENVHPLPGEYTPAIPILAEPRTFMALVPANRALAVVQAIKGKYAEEMGKVRNRLPLTLGVVYAGRRTPLAAVLDAGRRMLSRQPMADGGWQVAAGVELRDIAPDDGWPKKAVVPLQRDNRKIHVEVSTVMGDGKTADVWYPYWQVAGKPTGRSRWFVGPDGEHWVHVCDLRPGDTVAFTPSTFDFEYLDTSARRFEVAYGADDQRRSANRRQRPYLLEEIDAIEQAWGEISRKSSSQIHMVEALVETKRREWGEPTGTQSVSPTFRQFVGDVLREAKVHSEALEQAAITGLLADALEIHLTIHKEKPQQEA